MRALRGSRARSALAGSIAAVVWGLQEPIDQRVFRCDYSDVAVLGKALTRRRPWWPLGLTVHALNGALFGLAYNDVRGRTRSRPVTSAVAMSLAEHVLLYPSTYLVDRWHPARRKRGVPPLLRNPRAFAQATWRHALFGVVLGVLADAFARR